MELFIVLWIACAIAGLIIDGGRGLILGFLFGVIGLLISAILKAGGK